MKYQIVNLPKISDPRGNLSVIDNDTVPFEIKRVYYLYDVPSGAERGGHAHKKMQQLLVALSGSFQVVLKSPTKTEFVTLNNPSKGLLIEPGTWREIIDFSSGAVCLAVVSTTFDEADYIRDFDEFKAYFAENK
nr:FdtA/QdtA family cupin domain-containing protein [uncultured Flavobacterium sp.]